MGVPGQFMCPQVRSRSSQISSARRKALGISSQLFFGELNEKADSRKNFLMCKTLSLLSVSYSEDRQVRNFQLFNKLASVLVKRSSQYLLMQLQNQLEAVSIYIKIKIMCTI
jgi:hypothetical protein